MVCTCVLVSVVPPHVCLVSVFLSVQSVISTVLGPVSVYHLAQVVSYVIPLDKLLLSVSIEGSWFDSQIS